MNVELARTFLAIVTAGSFVRAAEALHVTQTAVSARIQALESELGRPLFIRNKSGAALTPAGREFVPYATQMVQVWERARQQVGKPIGHDAQLALGGEFSLWSPLLLHWLIWLHRDRPNVALRTQVEAPDRLMDRLQTGSLDIAILHAPYHRRGVDIAPILDEELIAVTTAAGQERLRAENYVYVDWGPEFAARHDAAFPELRDSGLFVGFGPLALEYMLTVGGAGYFRARAVRAHLDAGRLFRVQDAPVFSYSVYAARAKSSDAALVEWAASGLRAIAKQAVG